MGNFWYDVSISLIDKRDGVVLESRIILADAWRMNGKQSERAEIKELTYQQTQQPNQCDRSALWFRRKPSGQNAPKTRHTRPQ